MVDEAAERPPLARVDDLARAQRHEVVVPGAAAEVGALALLVQLLVEDLGGGGGSIAVAE